MKIIYLALLSLMILSCSTKMMVVETSAKLHIIDSLYAVRPVEDYSPVDIDKLSDIYQEKKIGNMDIALLQTTKNQNALRNVLTSELQLLRQWEPVTDFKPYTFAENDSVRVRCASFDKAPATAERNPVFGMRTISHSYYKFVVPVAFHLIVGAPLTADNESDFQEKIANQLALLNKEFSRLNISFVMNSYDNWVNRDWYKSSYEVRNKAFKAMCNRVAIDPENVMNVYISNCALLGEATFPWYDTNGTALDYVLINFNSLPGGSTDYNEGKYNEGKTLIHEVGHYLGLYHTFEGGARDCDDANKNRGCEIGDLVDDTPSQNICYFSGCGFIDDKECDSCPSDGKDPVKNFMGYNPDSCMDHLTEGQVIRMKSAIIKFRPSFIANPL